MTNHHHPNPEGYVALRRMVAAKYETTETTRGGIVRPKTRRQRVTEAAVCEAVVRFAFDHAGYGGEHLAPAGLEAALREQTRTGATPMSAAASVEAPMVFLDTETLGLGWHDAIWEVAAIRRVWGEPDVEFHAFVEHDPDAAAALPERFRADHDARSDPSVALSADELTGWLAEVAAPVGKIPAVLLGAVPSFDATRLFAQFGLNPFHYRVVCVETMAWTALLLETPVADGPLAAPGAHDPLSLPWASDPLTRALGVPSVTYEDGRHTTLVDARWARDTFDARWARDTFDAVMARRPQLAGLVQPGLVQQGLVG